MLIDLSKYKLTRDNYSEIEKYCKIELSSKINKSVEELSVDHFYDMSDFGGDKNLHVLEISYEDEEDENIFNTHIFKEIGDLKFNVKADF